MSVKVGKNIVLDYLSFTVKWSEAGVKDVAKSMNLGELKMMTYGGMGYTQSAFFLDGGRIFWHDERPEMGIHIRLNSTSMALVGLTALGAINRVLDMGGQITRLDIAFDDLDGLLDINHMHEKLLAGNVQTRFRKVARIQGAIIGLSQNIGDTINVGSRTSHAFVRVYDKKREQEARGKDVSGIDTWTRVELELKSEKAHMFAGLLGECAAGNDLDAPAILCSNLLWGLLDFKIPNPDDENKSRWDTSHWWADFLEATAKLTLSIPSPEKTIEGAKAWVKNQVAPTLAMIVLSYPDHNDVSGYEFIMDAIQKGEDRLTEEQKRRLDLYNVQMRLDID